MPTTLHDIANQTGVSVMTVSRALADKPGVSAETKRRVMEAARRLGYTAGASVRTTGRSTNTIGVAVNHIGTEYIEQIIRGISDILDVAGYDMVIFNPARMRRVPDAYLRDLSQKAIDGLIIASATRIRDMALLQQVNRDVFPVVMIDQRADEDAAGGACVPYVTATNRQGALDATRYLIQLGHRRIGCVTGPFDESPACERLEGYQAALTQSHIPYDERLVTTGNFREESGYVGAQTILEADPSVTAIFAQNDYMAFGVVEAVKQMGRRVPEDISVIGFDDIRSSAHSVPPLTTVRQPLRQMGQVAAQMIMEALRGERLQTAIELHTSLILRETCLPLKG